MTVERALRALAGSFVLLSLALGWLVHPGFYWFTAFVGLNLLQSAFTNFCPAERIMRRLHLFESQPACCAPERGPTEVG